MNHDQPGGVIDRLKSMMKTYSQWTFLVMACLLPVVPSSAQTAHNQSSGREIDLAIAALDLKPGATVAEIGAGDARFSFRFAEVVGPEGRVYANELGESNARRISEAAERRDVRNLVAVEGGVDDARLPDECCDAMMMRHVYHMLTQPEPMAKSFFRALKPGGALLILEGDPQPGRRNAAGVPANRAGMGIDPQIVIDELTGVGFEFERRVPDWVGSDYALLFRKPEVERFVNGLSSPHAWLSAVWPWQPCATISRLSLSSSERAR